MIYIISIICGGGWYIREQKDTIKEQGIAIQSLTQEITVNQRPSIEPEERKVRVEQKIVEKKIVEKVKDTQCAEAYEKLKQQTLQCAYNLKFCQEAGAAYNKLKPENNDGTAK